MLFCWFLYNLFCPLINLQTTSLSNKRDAWTFNSNSFCCWSPIGCDVLKSTCWFTWSCCGQTCIWFAFFLLFLILWEVTTFLFLLVYLFTSNVCVYVLYKWFRRVMSFVLCKHDEHAMKNSLASSSIFTEHSIRKGYPLSQRLMKHKLELSFNV